MNNTEALLEPNNKASSKLTLSTLIALVAGNMIGAGAFLLPAELARIGNIGLVALAVSSLGALSLSLVFTRLSLKMPRSGGPYVYVKEGLGDFLGFQTAYGYWMAAWIGNVGIAVASVGYLATFFPAVNQTSFIRCIVTLTIIWLLSLLNLSTKNAGKFSLLTTVMRLIPLVLVGVAGFRYFNIEHFTSNFNNTGLSNGYALANATLLTMWLFLGLESATVPAESVDNPTRNIPLASILGLLIAIGVYALNCVALFGMIPLKELAHSSAPFVLAGERMFGSFGKWLVAVGALVASLGSLNGWILLSAQIPQAAAKDKFFPKFLNQETNGTPRAGVLLNAALMSMAVIISSLWDVVAQFTILITLATVLTVLSYFYAVVSGMIMLGKAYWRQHMIDTLIFGFAMLFSAYAVMGAGVSIAPVILLAFLVSILGFLVHRLYIKNH